uniref:Uncharacterized protein n=1 Tax=Candidatus Kentrum eta TaxID=2126337 RepID=A0A450UQZ0_9GAMM|nr:MAG: hypothetical protein BECKH772A_GA0070896_100808 [Candidatus Kentron sp. H]
MTGKHPGFGQTEGSVSRCARSIRRQPKHRMVLEMRRKTPGGGLRSCLEIRVVEAVAPMSGPVLNIDLHSFGMRLEARHLPRDGLEGEPHGLDIGG